MMRVPTEVQSPHTPAAENVDSGQLALSPTSLRPLCLMEETALSPGHHTQFLGSKTPYPLPQFEAMVGLSW